jgi:hypothetical protein
MKYSEENRTIKGVKLADNGTAKERHFSVAGWFLFIAVLAVRILETLRSL